MVNITIRLRISKRILKKLLDTPSPRPSMGFDEILKKYSEKLEKDMLEEFLSERR